MRGLPVLAALALFVALVPLAQGQTGNAFIPAARPQPADANVVTGFLTWNANKGGISWDALAPTEDPGGPADATLGVGSKAQDYAAWVAYSNTGQSSLITTLSFTSAPVPEILILNTSVPIRVEIQRQKCFAATAELWMGTTFVGGQMFGIASSRALKPGAGYCAGVFGTFHLHPEVGVIPQGAVLTLKLLIQDQNDPIRIGMKDDHRSLVLFPVYTPEELVFRGLGPDGRVVEANEAGALVLAGLAPALLLVPRRRVAPLAVLLMLLAAGCAGPASDPGGPAGQGSPQPTGGKINSTVIKGTDIPKGLVGGENGSILGKVHDDLSFPIAGAHVVLEGTSHYADTDQHGQFALKGVPPGSYTMFVQHESYKAFQATVDLGPSELLRVDIELELLVPREVNDRPHRHDYWPEGGTVERFNGDVSTGAPDTCVSSVTELAPLFFPPGSLTMPSYCEYPLFLRPDPAGRSTVLPGTREIEIKISWPGTQNVAQRIGVGWQSNLDGFTTFMYPRGNGATTRIQVGPEHADFGHQLLSSWRFFLYYWNNGGGQSLGGDGEDGFVMRPAGGVFTTALHAEVRLHKGAVPLEPAHPDPWGANETLPVWDGKISASCLGSCNHPSTWYTTNTFTGWKEGRLVPPGTEWLEVVLTRTGSPGALPNTKWGLLYKPANVPFPNSGGDFSQFRAMPAPTITGATWRYVVPVKAEELDSYYAKRSNWAIAIDDGLDGEAFGYSDSVQFDIQLVAHRDPIPK